MKGGVSIIHPKYLQELAIKGLKAEIAALTALLDQLERGTFAAVPDPGPRKARRPMSAARRAAIAKRMKAYWKRKKAVA